MRMRSFSFSSISSRSNLLMRLPTRFLRFFVPASLPAGSPPSRLLLKAVSDVVVVLFSSSAPYASSSANVESRQSSTCRSSFSHTSR